MPPANFNYKSAYARLMALLGMDRAIAASTATQLVRFVTGPITMMLMIKHLRPVEQGYFYSFAGVIGIQVFLEAGFAQSITQFSSKEFAWLRFNGNGVLVGKRDSLSRLRSLFQKANLYYSIMGGALMLTLMGGGYLFFSSKPDHGVAWLTPWLVGSACAAIGFTLTPFWALLEGCNRITEVASYRFWASIVGFATTSICLLLGLGIDVVIWSSVVSVAFPVAYLALKWRKLAIQILRPPGKSQVSWRREIWGFQWRIAGTWMSRYFLESGLAPLAMQLHGPVVSGQIGMTFQMIRMIGGIANTWTAVRIPSWGALAAKGMWTEVNAAWSLAARRSVGFCVLGMSAFVIALLVFQWLLPGPAARFLPASSAAGFAIGWVLYSIWLVSMHYTRALRREPYTFLHLGVGISFLAASVLLSSKMGDATIPWIFAAVHIPAAAIAWRILHHIRTTTPQQSLNS
ncbi:hypothetical protein [Luteolibacter yonseiensis]